jgi:hypothetical protein
VNDNLKEQIGSYVLSQNPNVTPDEISALIVEINDVIVAFLLSKPASRRGA